MILFQPLLFLGHLAAWVGLLLPASPVPAAVGDTYLVGAGKGDITGPVVELPFSGYAIMSQRGTGVRQRVYARAFIVGETRAEHAADRFVYLVLDAAFGDTAVRRGIIEGVRALGPEYAAVYGDHNVAVVGTHSHSGPGGWNNYILPLVPTLGFSKASYQAVVDGAVRAVRRAHERLAPGTLDVGTADVADGNINRSLFAYLNNPQAERDRYNNSATNTQMTLLRMRRASDGKVLALLNWYAVHGTSAYNNNTLVTGDNKGNTGVAAYLFERAFAADPRAAPGFVAGFSQADVGDVSPNVLGAWCQDGSGQRCNDRGSTCPGGNLQMCHGRGPAFDAGDKGLSSCFEIGRRQYSAAKEIMDSIDSSGTPVVGPTVKAFHFFHDMQYYRFPLANGTLVETCPGALGNAFGAGTTDGPGQRGFTQNDSDPNPFWQRVSTAVRNPSARQKACQGVKPILIDCGEISWPYAWCPNIVDVQMLRVGQLVMIVSPAEATMMAGRRWREAVAAATRTILDGSAEPVVVLGGPANTYSHYAVTPEEYDIQRYEGASTLYGKWTLDAHIHLTTSNIQYLAPGSSGQPPAGPSPPDTRSQGRSFLTPVVFDSAPRGRRMGECIAQPADTYPRGAVVRARFQAANPRNDLRLEGTYAAVERQQPDGSWTQIRSDADWWLTYEWKNTNILLGFSEVVLTWETREDAEPGGGVDAGTYRFRYYGDRKAFGAVSAFEGVSSEFTIV